MEFSAALETAGINGMPGFYSTSHLQYISVTYSHEDLTTQSGVQPGLRHFRPVV